MCTACTLWYTIMYPSWLWQMMHRQMMHRYCMYSIMYLYTPPGTGSWMPHWLLYCKLGRSFYHCLDIGKVYMVLHVQDLHRSLPRIYHTMLLKITPQFQTFTISLPHDGEHLQYFKVFIFDLADFKVIMIFYIHKKLETIHWLKLLFSLLNVNLLIF